MNSNREKKVNPFVRIFELYTSDMTFNEIEKLIKRDASDVYEYFAGGIRKEDYPANKPARILFFVRNLFNAFILTISPARRIFYLSAVLFFFVAFIQSLPIYYLLSFLIMNLLLVFELADKLTLKDDLKIAKKIQNSLLPKIQNGQGSYSIAEYYESARDVGGDYLDFIRISDNNSMIVIGDISGKGFAAALYMVRVQAIIHAILDRSQSPKEVLIGLKNIFLKNLNAGYFLTITAANLSQDGSIKLSNAGHNPILLYKSKENEFTEINPKGIAIGLNDKGLFESVIEEAELKLNLDDILLFYTDGLVEAMNPLRREFGIDRVKHILLRAKDKDADEIRKQIIESLSNFREDDGIFDDITFLVIKKK